MARYTLFRELRYEHHLSQGRIEPAPDRVPDAHDDPWDGAATGFGAGSGNWRRPRGLPLRHNQSGETSRCPIS